MLKYRTMATNRLVAVTIASAMCLPLAGCLNAADPWGEGSMAYTADEMYPIGVHKRCGQQWPDLGNDETNHLSPNHGCAVHANIAAMVANPKVLRKPRKLDQTPGNTAAAAITKYEDGSSTQSAGSTTSSASSGTTP